MKYEHTDLVGFKEQMCIIFPAVVNVSVWALKKKDKLKMSHFESLVKTNKQEEINRMFLTPFLVAVCKQEVQRGGRRSKKNKYKGYVTEEFPLRNIGLKKDKTEKV